MKSSVQNQKVNTRRGSDQQGQNNQGQNTQGTGIPMPPPLTPEQYFQLQMQMMATLNNTVQALQQAHTQPPPPPPPQPRDRRAEFLRGHPPTFSHTSDPLQADDWLRAVERQLDIAQCDDRERVLYYATHVVHLRPLRVLGRSVAARAATAAGLHGLSHRRACVLSWAQNRVQKDPGACAELRQTQAGCERHRRGLATASLQHGRWRSAGVRRSGLGRGLRA